MNENLPVYDWIKDLRPFVVSIATVVVSTVTVWVTWWLGGRQDRIEKEQLKHQLYDHRMAVYDSLRDLLLALPKKGNDSDDAIKDLFRKADFARRAIVYLFNDNQKILNFSEQLCEQVTNEVVNNKDDLVKTSADILYNKTYNPKLERIKQHEAAKLKIYDNSTHSSSSCLVLFSSLLIIPRNKSNADLGTGTGAEVV